MAKNFEHIIHKNSSALVDNNPKLPTSGQLEYGEIAINYAKDKETISLKNSNNEIVTFTSDKKLDNYYTKEEIDNDHLVISSSLNDLNTRLNTKQDTLVSGTNIKTINNQSILGSGNITLTGGSGGGGDINVIESVKVNGSALTPDANKAVNITAVPATIVTQDTIHRFVSDSEKTTWDDKVSNVQADWNATSGLAQILNKPTIPAAVTESTVSGWGFTKNTGTVTGVKINGTTKNPTSGVVDLGTVITSHQDISGKADKSAAIGSLSLSLDSTNYKITLSGTKVDGTTFTVSDVIDLPLESVVVNGSYNNTTKKVVLTLQSGSTVEFSVADLVSGLQSEITSTNKLSADLIADGTTNKVVTASEKTTWNGKQDALTNADVLTGITSTKVSNWDNAATNSHTHSNKSVLDGISSTDITNWNSKTDNVGTVTGVKMNGTTNNPTNGVVDLGTVITSETTLSKGSTSGTGNAVTDITVSGHQITLTKGTTFLTQHQSIKTLNGTALTGAGNITLTGVPAFSASDNGKILGVVNGQLAWVTPTTIYTGSGTPSSSTGNDGDIYLQTS